VSDRYRILADIDVIEVEARSVAERTVKWLVHAEIIAPELTESVFNALPGHLPGPRYWDALAVPDGSWTGAEGVEVHVGRQVFHPIDACSARCPHCGAHETDQSTVTDSIGAWFDSGVGGHRCPACGRVSALNDWKWDVPWAFGYCGLTFWNWPPFDPEFIAKLSAHLGHRIVEVESKL
jgi:hypothetical protein